MWWLIFFQLVWRNLLTADFSTLSSCLSQYRDEIFPLIRMSFTKLCDAWYHQLSHRRSHKLILLMNCYIALGCVARLLLCTGLSRVSRVALVRESLTYELDVQTPVWKAPQRISSFLTFLPMYKSIDLAISSIFPPFPIFRELVDLSPVILM